MRESKFTESQIVNILKEAEGGVRVADLCRQHGISESAFYRWRSQYGGMDATMIKRLKELELENKRLKSMYADAQLDMQILKESLAKKL